MTSISLTVTAVALQSQIQQLVQSYTSKIGPELKDLGHDLGELDILGSIMTECIAVLSSCSSPAPDSVGKALLQCQNVATTLQFDLSKIWSRKDCELGRDRLETTDFKAQELSSILSHIRSIRGTVLLLRQVVTDFQSQQLLRSLASAPRSSKPESSWQTVPLHADYTNVRMGQTCSNEADSQRDQTVQTMTFEELPDLTVFNATIGVVRTPNMVNTTTSAIMSSQRLDLALPDTVWIAVRGKYDTCSAADLISVDVLRRAGVLDMIMTIEPQSFTSLMTTVFTFDKAIDLNWCPNNSWCLFAGRFFVLDDPNCEFDMLIGTSTIRKHNMINANHTLILPLALKYKSKPLKLEEKRKAEEQRARAEMDIAKLAAEERSERLKAKEAYRANSVNGITAKQD